MAHEELKKQYEEDSKHHKRPWELWEYRDYNLFVWKPCRQEPRWHPHNKYRRKEPPFVPEYFSGLNWREALKKGLEGQDVEYSKDGGCWQGPGKLIKISDLVCDSQRFLSNLCWWTYIRTCPQPHAHPTITIGGVELPRPETEAPKKGQEVWLWYHKRIVRDLWADTPGMQTILKCGILHLTESRAQAWADYWENTVMAAVKGGE